MSNLTDEKEIKRIMDQFNNYNNYMADMIDSAEKVSSSGTKLPSIAIYCNNKMIEIYHQFKNSGVPYSSSFVNKCIEIYFCEMINRAFNVLVNYADKINKFRNLVKLSLGKSVCEEYITAYKTICDKILNFSLEKDGYELLNEAVDKNMKEYGSIGVANAMVDEMNQELAGLGISYQIEKRSKKLK